MRDTGTSLDTTLDRFLVYYIFLGALIDLFGIYGKSYGISRPRFDDAYALSTSNRTRRALGQPPRPIVYQFAMRVLPGISPNRGTSIVPEEWHVGSSPGGMGVTSLGNRFPSTRSLIFADRRSF